VADLSLDPEARRVGTSLLAGALELRSRGVKAIACLLVVFFALFPFSAEVFHFIAEPILAALPQGSSLISRQVASPFLTPLKATFWVALFLSMPLLLYHLWRLVDTWLPAEHRRIALPFVFASAILFYVGVAFAFLLVLPMAFGFFAKAAPAGVKVMTDITSFLDFTIGMSLAFGLAFQVPVVIVIIVWTGLVSRQALSQARPYVFLGAFVIGMVLTPPDVFSQTLLALPMYALYEGALLFCWRFLPERK
jgi:sec-independent protein translocase protein TatC